MNDIRVHHDVLQHLTDAGNEERGEGGGHPLHLYRRHCVCEGREREREREREGERRRERERVNTRISELKPLRGKRWLDGCSSSHPPTASAAGSDMTKDSAYRLAWTAS